MWVSDLRSGVIENFGALRFFAAGRLCEIIVFQPVYDSRGAVFDQHHMEVDQQAKPLVREPQI
jgi:hypothetical protein